MIGSKSGLTKQDSQRWMEEQRAGRRTLIVHCTIVLSATLCSLMALQKVDIEENKLEHWSVVPAAVTAAGVERKRSRGLCILVDYKACGRSVREYLDCRFGTGRLAEVQAEAEALMKNSNAKAYRNPVSKVISMRPESILYWCWFKFWLSVCAQIVLLLCAICLWVNAPSVVADKAALKLRLNGIGRRSQSRRSTTIDSSEVWPGRRRQK